MRSSLNVICRDKVQFFRQRLDCDSSSVIYLATYQKCKGQYIGKSTTPFKKRHSNHKQEVRWGKGGLGQHFGGGRACNYKDMSIQLIEKVEKGRKG